jgi:hypothetical protein
MCISEADQADRLNAAHLDAVFDGQAQEGVAELDRVLLGADETVFVIVVVVRA